MNRIDTLLTESGLPGPRANLTLMHTFALSATQEEAFQCMSYLRDDLSNSPEEYVTMCGIVATCVIGRDNPSELLNRIRPYASHKSWRVRESVAIGIQEISVLNADAFSDITTLLQPWAAGNPLEQRAVVAALCEPKLLKDARQTKRVLALLADISAVFGDPRAKLTEEEQVLRRTLGYGWSVAIAALPSEGKIAFEALAGTASAPHVAWIVRENLSKKRLSVMDSSWVRAMKETLAEVSGR